MPTMSSSKQLAFIDTPSNSTSPAQMVNVCNTIFDAFRAAGMVRVSNADFVGQSEGLTLVDPAPEGWVKYVPPSGTKLTAICHQVYKHPTLPVYVKVLFRVNGHSSAAYNIPNIVYTIFTKIKDGAIDGGSIDIIPHLQIPQTTYPPTESFPRKTCVLNSYTDENTFWIASDIAALPNGSAWNSEGFLHLFGVSFVNLFIQKSNEGEIIILTNQYVASDSSSYVNMGLALNDVTNMGRYGSFPRKWALNSGVFTQYISGGQPFTYLTELSRGTSANGVRVARATAYSTQGQKCHYNFGTVNSAAAQSGSTIQLNLDGTGVRDYHVYDSFSPMNYLQKSNNPTADNLMQQCLSLVLPWKAP